MSCKCCAGPCRKRKAKKRGPKKPKAAKQPTVSISLAPPTQSKMSGLAPTFQSSVSTPLSEQQRGIPSLPSRRSNLMREMESQMKPESSRSEMGIQTVALAGGRSDAEERERSSFGLPGETRAEYRIRTFKSQ